MSKTSVRYHQLTLEIVQVVTAIRCYLTNFGGVRYHRQTSDGIKPFLIGLGLPLAVVVVCPIVDDFGKLIAVNMFVVHCGAAVRIGDGAAGLLALDRAHNL